MQKTSDSFSQAYQFALRKLYEYYSKYFRKTKSFQHLKNKFKNYEEISQRLYNLKMISLYD